MRLDGYSGVGGFVGNLVEDSINWVVALGSTPYGWAKVAVLFAAIFLGFRYLVKRGK